MSTTLRGGTSPTVAAGAGALNASNASFGYDGNDYALDLSGSATYAAIATVIQTAIAANLTGATFTYDTASGRFLLTRADAAPGDAFFAPHSAGTGTDATVELGMALASDPAPPPGARRRGSRRSMGRNQRQRRRARARALHA